MTTSTHDVRIPLHGISLRAILRGSLATMSLWHARWTQRIHLADLTDSQLRDVGIGAGPAQAEAIKPFWEA